ncbi:MAG: hypothetical protein R3B89_30615 [Polyangiaceae bacterium]
MDRQAELTKLARVLAVEPGDLAFLEGARVSSLREFRRAATHTLFDDGRETFRRLAKLSRLLPVPLLVRFTTSLVGPELAGRVASEMEPERAARMSSELPVDFLGEVCLHLDPERSREVIRGIAPTGIRDVGLELLRRKEYICMARFVDVLEESVLAQMMAAIVDETDLLRIGFYVEDKAQLDMLIGLLDDERLERLLFAANRAALWPEAIALMNHVRSETRARLGDLTAQQPEELIHGLVFAAHEAGLWPELLDIVAHMSAASQLLVVQRLATSRFFESPAFVTGYAALQARVEGLPTGQKQ